MTDHKDSKISDAAQPPTDRPLTAGDYCTVPKEPTEEMLNEAQEEFPRSARYAFGKIWSAMLRARPPFADYDYGSFEPGADAPTARPAASEGEGVERTIDGETVLGFKVAAWRFDTKCPQDQDKEKWDSFFGKSGPPHTYCEHWSTPGAGASNVERLFTEAQLRAALASPPVSERERELEGALLGAVEGLEWIGRLIVGSRAVASIEERENDLGLSVNHIQSAALRAAAEARRALTAQPAGEGK